MEMVSVFWFLMESEFQNDLVFRIVSEFPKALESVTLKNLKKETVFQWDSESVSRSMLLWLC